MTKKKWFVSKKTVLLSVLVLTIVGALVGVYLITKTEPSRAAGTAVFSLTPNTVLRAPTETFSVESRVNITADTANAVELDVTYNAAVVELVSWTNSTQCSVEFANVNTLGKLTLDVGCSPAVSASTPNALISTLNFKAKAVGTTNIAYTATTKAVNGTTGLAVPATYTNTAVTVSVPVNSVTVTSNKNRLMPTTSNYVLVTAKTLSTAGAVIPGKAITVTGLRAGDTLTPSGSTTNANGEITYTLKGTTVGSLTLTFTSEGKSQTATFQVSKDGDLNGDASINIFDASVLMTYWGQTVANTVLADINCDGSVNIFDASILMSSWGN